MVAKFTKITFNDISQALSAMQLLQAKHEGKYEVGFSVIYRNDSIYASELRIGNEYSVALPYTDNAKTFSSNMNLLSVHYHPNESFFSWNDLRVATDMNIEMSIVFTPTKVYAISSSLAKALIFFYEKHETYLAKLKNEIVEQAEVKGKECLIATSFNELIGND
jgi:hypothetical protein